MTRHEALFAQYVAELEEVKGLAEAWWQAVLSELTARMGDPGAAERELRARWPFGPTSHPWVIAVFRKFYLQCDALNREIEEARGDGDEAAPAQEEEWGREEEERESEQRVPPWVFLADQLGAEGKEDLYNFVLSMVLVPVGMKNGELV